MGISLEIWKFYQVSLYSRFKYCQMCQLCHLSIAFKLSVIRELQGSYIKLVQTLHSRRALLILVPPVMHRTALLKALSPPIPETKSLPSPNMHCKCPSFLWVVAAELPKRAHSVRWFVRQEDSSDSSASAVIFVKFWTEVTKLGWSTPTKRGI